MFFAHPVFIASRSAAFRIAPRPSQAKIHRFACVEDEATQYVPVAHDDLPAALKGAIEQWPGPCIFFARHCDDGAYVEPWASAPSEKEIRGVSFSEEEYAANRIILQAQEAADAARRAAEEQWRAIATDWYADNAEALATEACAAGLSPASASNGFSGVAERWLEARAQASEPGHARARLGLSEGGWPYLLDAPSGQGLPGFLMPVRDSIRADWRYRLYHRSR